MNDKFYMTSSFFNNVLAEQNVHQQYPTPDEDTINKCKQLFNVYLDSVENIKKLQKVTKEQKNIKTKTEEDLLKIMANFGLEELKDKNKNIKIKVNNSERQDTLPISEIKKRLCELDINKYRSPSEISKDVLNRQSHIKPNLKLYKNIK